jgi:hypothetical protein
VCMFALDLSKYNINIFLFVYLVKFLTFSGIQLTLRRLLLKWLESLLNFEFLVVVSFVAYELI